ncbi:unnamed protein product, partial [Polarella glacialis]
MGLPPAFDGGMDPNLAFMQSCIFNAIHDEMNATAMAPMDGRVKLSHVQIDLGTLVKFKALRKSRNKFQSDLRREDVLWDISERLARRAAGSSSVPSFVQLLQQMQRGQVPPLGNGQKEEQARPVEEDFDEKTAPAGTKAPEAKGAAVNGENRSVWNKVQDPSSNGSNGGYGGGAEWPQADARKDKGKGKGKGKWEDTSVSQREVNERAAQRAVNEAAAAERAAAAAK